MEAPPARGASEVHILNLLFSTTLPAQAEDITPEAVAATVALTVTEAPTGSGIHAGSRWGERSSPEGITIFEYYSGAP